MSNDLTLKIGWLYPQLMSTYGDRGNVFVLQKRCQWRGIKADIVSIDSSSTETEILNCDLLLGGGSQDRQQAIVIEDLLKRKKILSAMTNDGIPGLFVCGSPQLLGHYFIGGDGKKIEGLGIFDMWTEYPKDNRPRCIGNLVGEIDERFNCNYKSLTPDSLPAGRQGLPPTARYIIGFENHGGRTQLGKVEPFAKVVVGFGNNGEDKTEGAIFQNVIATYSHGPFLPKNPHIADFLLAKALETKTGKMPDLEPLDDSLEWQTHDAMLKKLGVSSN